jgi:CxxC motif-containing protein (DUF1111 family)
VRSGRRRSVGTRNGITTVAFTLALVFGCVDAPDPVEQTSWDEEEAALSLTSFGGRTIGDVLPGTDMSLFEEAAEAFGEEEDIDEGLGPIFNERGCGSCHTTPVMGGSGEQIERRFGSIVNGEFYGYDADPDNHGGTLRQLFSNGTYTVGTQVCEIPVEVEPSGANVNNVGRRTTPLFGLGLVDAMPDWFFDLLASLQPPSIRGVAQRVPVALPDPRDPRQSIGSLRVGRFGWKGRVPSLMQFSGDAYTNEMGITTQSCFRGQSITAFAFENLPNNITPADGCNGGDLAPVQAAHADVPEFTDDAVGPCTGGLTEIQDDLILFTAFMESLAPPPRDLSDVGAILRGGPAFLKAGCAGCHTPTVFVTPPRPHNGVPGFYPFQPFSDFLAHDMGSLGDRIGDSGDTEEVTRRLRTAPLWGARFNTSFLHDGRAPDIRSAILAHDGQGRAARIAFERLRSYEQDALIRYVLSL